MFTIISDFATTDIVFANSHGPYVVDGGSALTLTAGLANPHASYQWDLGDGTKASTPTVVHTYGNDGFYVAKLTVTVNQPGGDTSQHYALIRVRNVPPVVNVGPNRTVNEGEVVAFTATFSDVQWLETHQATWDWGDPQKPDPGVVTETHNPPAAQGTVTGSHAWGDSGTYTVTLRVRDQGGAIGKGTTTITVLNVPPKVDAGPPMYAYPCCVLTLQGKFTDPGWLDSHAGFWDFGDCTGSQRAVVREKHDPPAGQGVAIASHVYHQCGTYEATCTVIDDDGGVGKSSTVVMVVDLRNKEFEEGFCSRQWGVVANDWKPYIAPVVTLGSSQNTTPVAVSTGGDIFLAEEYCVHGGERSQRIRFSGKSRAGLMQTVGANAGWDYQISVWYSLNEQSGGISQLLMDVEDPSEIIPPDRTGGIARLGIDPTGGTDPLSQDIVWSEGYLRPEWAQLSVRATAAGTAISVYLEGEGFGRLGADVFFDDAALLAVQPFCPPPSAAPEVCVDFSDLQPGSRLPAVYVKDKFTFVALDHQTQTISSLGPPIGQNALQVHPRGLEIDPPFLADWVRVTLYAPRGIHVVVSAFDSHGNQVSQGNSSIAGGVQTVEVDGKGIAKVIVIGKEGVSIIKVCAHPYKDPESVQPGLNLGTINS